MGTDVEFTERPDGQIDARLTLMRVLNVNGTISAVNLTASRPETRRERRVPAWAAALFDQLSRELPSVVTLDDVALGLQSSGTSRSPESAVRELRRLGWLEPLPVHGAWTFMPAGQSSLADPYLSLRAWLAVDPTAGLMLAGAASAWHLGYLDRQPAGRTDIWLPAETRLPDGLRPFASVSRIRWHAASRAHLTPSRHFLIRRKLDLLRWADGLPAFGPEALLAQLAIRPSSFEPWTDLVAHLPVLVGDCDDTNLCALLEGKASAAWQRAAYIVHAGGSLERGMQVLARRPDESMSKARFNVGGIDLEGVWSADFQVLDTVIAPLQAVTRKA